MRYVVLFIVIVIIALIYSYPWYFVGLIAAIVIGRYIYKTIKEINEEVERERQEKERAIEFEKRKREEEERRLEKVRTLEKAVSEGKYVCWKCETIEPKRCVECQLCLSCWENRSRYYSNLCKHHGQIEADKIIAAARSKGHAICEDCLTIDPPRCCYCNNCLICFDRVGDMCIECDDD